MGLVKLLTGISDILKTVVISVSASSAMNLFEHW